MSFLMIGESSRVVPAGGWPDKFVWQAIEGELSLRCSQDRTGHVTIRVELRSGPSAGDWAVQVTVMTEAGQLEGLARQAE